MSRDYEPVPGQWYENLEEEEPFRVLSMDEDSELVEIEYLDGDIEEIDLETTPCKGVDPKDRLHSEPQRP